MVYFSSRYRLQVRAHDVGDTANDGEAPDFIRRRPPSVAALAERFQSNVEPDFIPVFEAVCDGLGRAVDTHRNAFNNMLFNSLVERRAREAHNAGLLDAGLSEVGGGTQVIDPAVGW